MKSSVYVTRLCSSLNSFVWHRSAWTAWSDAMSTICRGCCLQPSIAFQVHGSCVSCCLQQRLQQRFAALSLLLLGVVGCSCCAWCLCSMALRVCMSRGAAAGLVCFWDLVEETMVHQIQAHQSAVCSIAIHPEAKCIVTASNDGSAKVWHPPAAL